MMTWLASVMIRTNSPVQRGCEPAGQRGGFVTAAFTACEFRFGGHELGGQGFGATHESCQSKGR
jgi:hypothetical protein